MKIEREYPSFIITKKGCAWVGTGHPWIYAQEIISKSAEPENGALVDALSENGRYLGTGLYSRESKIGLRLISRNANDRFDAEFWKRRIRYAWDYRRTVMGGDVSCCRVIFGEADGFPGLTVDRFSSILVTQTLSVGMERLKDVIFPLLAEVLRESGERIDGIYERNDVAIRALKALPRGGYFATASCSHFMPSELFVKMLRSAAQDANVELRQIEARQQAPDHPILWNVPETDYLKFYIFQVV